MLTCLFMAASTATGDGFRIAGVFTIITGAEHRIAEDQGLDPVYVATWIVVGTNVGLPILALAMLSEILKS